MENKFYDFVLKNNIDELETLCAKLEFIAEEWSLNQKLLFNINLCLDELVTNIVSYGYEDKEEHQIKISMTLNEKMLTVILSDDAKPFNPLQKSEVNTDIPIEERQIGGLGIHFVKKIMDSLEYQRENGNNILTLKININKF